MCLSHKQGVYCDTWHSWEWILPVTQIEVYRQQDAVCQANRGFAETFDSTVGECCLSHKQGVCRGTWCSREQDVFCQVDRGFAETFDSKPGECCLLHKQVVCRGDTWPFRDRMLLDLWLQAGRMLSVMWTGCLRRALKHEFAEIFDPTQLHRRNVVCRTSSKDVKVSFFLWTNISCVFLSLRNKMYFVSFLFLNSKKSKDSFIVY